ncbi:hypothetical protein QTP88_027489 [Uroleucon formosanum]
MTRSTREYKSDKTGKGFVNSLINNLPFEAHVPGYQYCGPGTKLKKRLDRSDEGINPLDAACRDHDIVYATSKNLNDRHKADKVLENRACERFKAEDSSSIEREIGCVRELSALGSLMSGGASVYNAVQNSKRKKDNEGCYEVEDIKQRVKKQIDVYNSKNFTDLTFDITVDPNDFRSSIKCNGILHFEIPYSIAPVFGFEKRLYKPYIETLRSEKAVNLNTINSIKVMCNIAQGSFSNRLQSHSIYEFFPSERTESKVIQSPPNLIYYKLNKTDIDSITVQLVDQDHNPIDNFDITSQYETDSKITKIEYHSYTPYTTSFNNNDEIRISIQQTDVYPYLHESFIFLEGMFSEADKVKLSNNGYFYLFEQFRLEINGIEVDSTRVLGITSSLKGYLSGTPDNYNCYENSDWNFKNATQSANDKGEFSACIALKYWLGFFEDYRKILVNSRLELTLTRSHSDLNALRLKSGITASTAKVTLNKIIWKVPHITVDDGERLKLLKLVEKEKSLFILFRSFETFEYPELGTAKKVVWDLKTASKLEKPRFIII